MNSTRVRVVKETSNTKKNSKYNRLKNYQWGIGIEHEMHVFHVPDLKKLKKGEHIKDVIVYDSWNAVLNILQNPLSSKYGITPLQQLFLNEIPYETSGRRCKGKWVLKKIEAKMPEFVTDSPFSSLLHGKRSIEDYCRQLIKKEYEYKNILVDYDRLNQNKISKYGAYVDYYPTGMSSYIKEPKSFRNGEYQFKSGLTKDYLGSYHLTITLPYNNKMTNNAFIKMHQNFANQLQWIEPLLMTAFFSCDDTAVGTSKKKVRGSFRVMRVGWGNLAGSDIRKFDKGIGRYANIKTYWRTGLDFYDIEKLKLCAGVTIPEPGAISALSTNFRTFGAPDPEHPDERKSGSPMTIPNGIEFRIFDHFPTDYLPELCKLVILVAENSRKLETNKYVYKNGPWKNMVKVIMEEGWKAFISKDIIKELREVLGLKIKTENLQALNVLNVISNELYEKNKNGDWTYLMLDKDSLKSPPKLPKINQRSWELGFLIKMNRESHILNSWNLILRSIKNYEKFTLEEFEDMYYKAFNKVNWSSNLLDVIYFLESRNYITLKHDPEGHIIEFNVSRSDIKEWDNKTVDNYIVFEWGRHYYKNMENQLSQSALRNRVKEAGMEFPKDLPFGV
jgi:hypothetical protein